MFPLHPAPVRLPCHMYAHNSDVGVASWTLSPNITPPGAPNHAFRGLHSRSKPVCAFKQPLPYLLPLFRYTAGPPLSDQPKPTPHPALSIAHHQTAHPLEVIRNVAMDPAEADVPKAVLYWYVPSFTAGTESGDNVTEPSSTAGRTIRSNPVFRLIRRGLRFETVPIHHHPAGQQRSLTAKLANVSLSHRATAGVG